MSHLRFFAGTAVIAVAACATGFLISAWLHGGRTVADTATSALKKPPGQLSAMVWIPGGEFLMGSSDDLARPNEGPVHRVQVDGFCMDRYDVTNADFRRFVSATGYVTTAERKPDWNELKLQLPPGTPKPSETLLVPGSLVFVATDHPVSLEDWTQWWQWVPGADWRHPQGPDSDIESKDAYPVVQVSHADAEAYARWSGKRLATEAEWEFAARGGLADKRYSWGDQFTDHGKPMANTWEGTFPVNSGEHGLTRVGSFPPNGYGLFDMAGNAWQWTADWYRADAYTAGNTMTRNPAGPRDSYDPEDASNPNGPKRAIRGGSYLCTAEYCVSYRPSSRRGESPDTSTSHIGFRTASNHCGAPAAG